MITDGRTPLAKHCNVVASFSGAPKMLTPKSGRAREAGVDRTMKHLVLALCVPGQTISIKEIIRALPDKHPVSLAKAVSYLIADRLLYRVRRGHYRRA